MIIPRCAGHETEDLVLTPLSLCWVGPRFGFARRHPYLLVCFFWEGKSTGGGLAPGMRRNLLPLVPLAWCLSACTAFLPQVRPSIFSHFVTVWTEPLSLSIPVYMPSVGDMVVLLLQLSSWWAYAGGTACGWWRDVVACGLPL